MKLISILFIIIMIFLIWFLIQSVKFSSLVFPDNLILYLFISFYILISFLGSMELEK
jgi:hypothetical protein